MVEFHTLFCYKSLGLDKEPVSVFDDGTISGKNSIAFKGSYHQANESVQLTLSIPKPASLSANVPANMTTSLPASSPARKRHSIINDSTPIDEQNKELLENDNVYRLMSPGGSSDDDHDNDLLDSDDDSSEDIVGFDKYADNRKGSHSSDGPSRGVDGDNDNQVDGDHSRSKTDDQADYDPHVLNHNNDQGGGDVHSQVNNHNFNQNLVDDQNQDDYHADDEDAHNCNQVDGVSQVDYYDRSQVSNNHRQTDCNHHQVNFQQHNHNDDDNYNRIQDYHSQGSHSHNQAGSNHQSHNQFNENDHDDSNNIQANKVNDRDQLAKGNEPNRVDDNEVHNHRDNGNGNGNGDDKNHYMHHDKEDHDVNLEMEPEHCNEGDLNHNDDQSYNRILLKLLCISKWVYLLVLPLVSLVLCIICCFLLLNTGFYCRVSLAGSDQFQTAGCLCQVLVGQSITYFQSVHNDSYPVTGTINDTSYDNKLFSTNLSDAGVPSSNVTQLLLKGDNKNQTKVYRNKATLDSAEVLSSTYYHIKLQFNNRLTFGICVRKDLMQLLIRKNTYIAQCMANQFENMFLLARKKVSSGYNYQPVAPKASAITIQTDHQETNKICPKYVSTLAKKQKDTIVAVSHTSQAYQLVDSQAIQLYGNIPRQPEVQFSTVSIKEPSISDSESSLLVSAHVMASENDTVTAVSQEHFTVRLVFNLYLTYGLNYHSSHLISTNASNITIESTPDAIERKYIKVSVTEDDGITMLSWNQMMFDDDRYTLQYTKWISSLQHTNTVDVTALLDALQVHQVINGHALQSYTMVNSTKRLEKFDLNSTINDRASSAYRGTTAVAVIFKDMCVCRNMSMSNKIYESHYKYVLTKADDLTATWSIACLADTSKILPAVNRSQSTFQLISPYTQAVPPVGEDYMWHDNVNVVTGSIMCLQNFTWISLIIEATLLEQWTISEHNKHPQPLQICEPRNATISNASDASCDVAISKENNNQSENLTIAPADFNILLYTHISGSTYNLSQDLPFCEIGKLTKQFCSMERQFDHSICQLWLDVASSKNANKSNCMQLHQSGFNHDVILCINLTMYTHSMLDCYPWSHRLPLAIFPTYCDDVTLNMLLPGNSTTQFSIQSVQLQISNNLSIHNYGISLVKKLIKEASLIGHGLPNQRQSNFLSNCHVISSTSRMHIDSNLDQMKSNITFPSSDEWIKVLETNPESESFCRILSTNEQNDVDECQNNYATIFNYSLSYASVVNFTSLQLDILDTSATAMFIFACFVIPHHMNYNIVLSYQECVGIKHYNMTCINNNSWTGITSEVIDYQQDLFSKVCFSHNIMIEKCSLSCCDFYEKNISILQSHCHLHDDCLLNCITGKPVDNFSTSSPSWSAIHPVPTSSEAIPQYWLFTSPILHFQNNSQHNIYPSIQQHDDGFNNCRLLVRSLTSFVQLVSNCIIFCWDYWELDVLYNFNYSLSDSAVEILMDCKSQLNCRKIFIVCYGWITKYQKTSCYSLCIDGCIRSGQWFFDWCVSPATHSGHSGTLGLPQTCYNCSSSLKCPVVSVDYMIMLSAQNFFCNDYTYSLLSPAMCQEVKVVIDHFCSSLLNKLIRIPLSDINSDSTPCYHYWYKKNFFRSLDHCKDNCYSIQYYLWCVSHASISCPAITIDYSIIYCSMTYYQHHTVIKGYIKTELRSDCLIETITVETQWNNIIIYDLVCYTPSLLHCCVSSQMFLPIRIIYELNCENSTYYFEEMLYLKLTDNQDEIMLLRRSPPLMGMYSEVSTTRIYAFTAKNLLQTHLQQCCIDHTNHSGEHYMVTLPSHIFYNNSPCSILTFIITGDILIANKDSNIFRYCVHLHSETVHLMLNTFNQSYNTFKTRESSVHLCYKHCVLIRSRWRLLIDYTFIQPIGRQHYVLCTSIKLTWYCQSTVMVSTDVVLDSLHAMACKNLCLQEFSMPVRYQDSRYIIMDSEDSCGDDKMARNLENCNNLFLLLSFFVLSMGVMCVRCILLWKNGEGICC